MRIIYKFPKTSTYRLIYQLSLTRHCKGPITCIGYRNGKAYKYLLLLEDCHLLNIYGPTIYMVLLTILPSHYLSICWMQVNIFDADRWFRLWSCGFFELHVDTLKAKISVLDSATCKTSKNGKLRIEIEGNVNPMLVAGGDEYSYRINSGSWVHHASSRSDKYTWVHLPSMCKMPMLVISVISPTLCLIKRIALPLKF